MYTNRIADGTNCAEFVERQMRMCYAYNPDESVEKGTVLEVSFTGLDLILWIVAITLTMTFVYEFFL